jgi:hypothetical protein
MSHGAYACAVPTAASTTPSMRSVEALGTTLLFVALTPFLVDQVDSELAQLFLFYLASFGLGFWCGFALPGLRHASYVALAVAFGAAVMIALWIYLEARYPSAAFLFEAWGVRFGLGGGLVFVGGLLLGDMVERKKLSVGVTLLASLASLVGAILGILKTLSEND